MLIAKTATLISLAANGTNYKLHSKRVRESRHVKRRVLFKANGNCIYQCAEL